MQRGLELYANAFGLIVWRVFSVDVVRFYVRIHRAPREDHARRTLVSRWGWRHGLRYAQVAEAIAVTTLFTTLTYHPSNRALFVERVLRYARTVPHRSDELLVFEYVAVEKGAEGWAFVSGVEFDVDVGDGTVGERVLDPDVSPRRPHPGSTRLRGRPPGLLCPGVTLMCGIAGVFGRSDPATVAAMCAAPRHRGPDDEFLVSGERFALGALRLSIVDVAGGRQPLANEDATIWAAQNGELYNFAAVARELRAEGHVLHTACDTEVLPHLYERERERLPERIHGMFALAVWDSRTGVGLLARDRMGKKPLYYLEDREALYFASEIKALLLVPGFERRLHLEALHHYLSFKHVPHPLTIFEGSRRCRRPRDCGSARGEEPVVERYWHPSFAAGEPVEEGEAIERVLDLLKTAVTKRLMGDVPVGFFLSGGVDSSLTTALAAEASAGPVKTFTLTYDNAASTPGKEEDRRWARHVSALYGTEHVEETIDFGRFPDAMTKVLRCFDEPFAGVVSTYFLSGVIAQHVKVAVAGDGADELFGSYLSHRLAQPLAGVGAPAPADVGRPELDTFRALPDWRWRGLLFVLDEDEKRGLYAPDTAAATAGFDSVGYLCASGFDELSARDPLNRVLEAEFRTFLPDQVLTFVDRLSMVHALEIRSAFLDTDVVEYVNALPGSLKIRDGQTKYLLKRVAERYLPAEMVWREKEGFVMPVADWLRRDLVEYVRDALSPARVGRVGVFDAGAVTRVVDGFYGGDGDHRFANKVLALLLFHEWYDLYLGAHA